MEKRSTHYGDIQIWIEKVIDSCKTYDQVHSTRSLIWNFEKQMTKNKVNISIKHSISRELLDLMYNKMDELLEKRLKL